MTNPVSQFDIVIVGGGMVGASLACLLGQQGNLKIALVEAAPILSERKTVRPFSPSYDLRSTALAYGTQKIFEQIGVWDKISQRLAPIHQIHVSDQGRFGFTLLDREQENVQSLGVVVENAWLGHVLCQSLLRYESLALFTPATVQSLQYDGQNWQLAVQQADQAVSLKGKLLIAADGVNSTCCRLLNIEHEVIEYNQSAIIANLSPRRPHGHIAYERFTQSGPMALLPLPENRMALVFTVASDELQYYLQMSDPEFLRQVDARIGGRLHGFEKLGQRAHYPLRLVRAQEQTRPQCVVVGNAAHTLHPVAGQGFNLSARDIALLAHEIKQAHKQGADFSSTEILSSYGQQRERDQEITIQFSDKLMKLFSNPLPGVSLARNMGMLAMDLWPESKHLLTRQAMGLSAGVPL